MAERQDHGLGVVVDIVEHCSKPQHCGHRAGPERQLIRRRELLCLHISEHEIIARHRSAGHRHRQCLRLRERDPARGHRHRHRFALDHPGGAGRHAKACHVVFSHRHRCAAGNPRLIGRRIRAARQHPNRHRGPRSHHRVLHSRQSEQKRILAGSECHHRRCHGDENPAGRGHLDAHRQRLRQRAAHRRSAHQREHHIVTLVHRHGCADRDPRRIQIVGGDHNSAQPDQRVRRLQHSTQHNRLGNLRNRVIHHTKRHSDRARPRRQRHLKRHREQPADRIFNHEIINMSRRPRNRNNNDLIRSKGDPVGDREHQLGLAPPPPPRRCRHQNRTPPRRRR